MAKSLWIVARLSSSCWYFPPNDIFVVELIYSPACVVWPRVCRRRVNIATHCRDYPVPGVWCPVCLMGDLSHKYISPHVCFILRCIYILLSNSLSAKFCLIRFQISGLRIHLNNLVDYQTRGKYIGNKRLITFVSPSFNWNIPEPDGSSSALAVAPSIFPLTFSRRGILIKFSCVSGHYSH